MSSFLGKDEPAPVNPPAADDEDRVPEGMTEKAGSRWKELKNEIKELRRKNEEALSSQVAPEELQKLKSAEAEVTSLREKLQTYEREIIGVKLEATDEYQKQVTRPLDTVRSVVQDLAETYELDIEALNSAVVEGNRKERVKKLAQLAESMLEPDRLKLYRSAEDFDNIVETKATLEENAAETLKRFEVERADAQRKQSVEELRKQKEAADDAAPHHQQPAELRRQRRQLDHPRLRPPRHDRQQRGAERGITPRIDALVLAVEEMPDRRQLRLRHVARRAHAEVQMDGIAHARGDGTAQDRQDRRQPGTAGHARDAARNSCRPSARLTPRSRGDGVRAAKLAHVRDAKGPQRRALVLAAGGGNGFDVFNYHDYKSWWTLPAHYDQFRAILDANGLSAVPIWVKLAI